MSNIYIQEPPTRGKVSLVTTVGEIEIELWSRECPKACRNFVQLSMEGYYDNTIFHRVVKDFIVQGGDPTGSGGGGESVWGKMFRDEFHSRLRFVRRGLVAMANNGVKDSNGSQFFFTLAPTPELQDKHTIFGKVAGNTLYNMLKLAEDVVVIDERPETPHKIRSTKVLINPFDDIEPRQLIKSIVVCEEERKKEKKPKSKMRATKDFSLLSFGDEAEQDEIDDDNFSKETRKKREEDDESANDSKNTKDMKEIPKDERLELEYRDKVDVSVIRDKLKTTSKESKSSKEVSSKLSKDDSNSKFMNSNSKEEERSKVRDEINRLKKEMRSNRGDKKRDRPQEVEDETMDETKETEEEANDMLASFHEEQKKYAGKAKVPKKGSAREEATLKLLEKFKNKLHNVHDDESRNSDDNEKDNDEVVGDGWMRNALHFEETGASVLAKDANKKDDSWFDIFDPRNPLNKRRRKADAKTGHKRKH